MKLSFFYGHLTSLQKLLTQFTILENDTPYDLTYHPTTIEISKSEVQSLLKLKEFAIT